MTDGDSTVLAAVGETAAAAAAADASRLSRELAELPTTEMAAWTAQVTGAGGGEVDLKFKMLRPLTRMSPK